MTLAEFKAWLDGFSEAIDEAPTAEQWAKVLNKLETVTEPRPEKNWLREIDTTPRTYIPDTCRTMYVTSKMEGITDV